MRQRLQTGIGGTLRFRPREAGAPSVATVTIKTSRGLDLPTPVVAQAAVVAEVTGGTELQFALSGAQCPDPLTKGPLYRAAWAYTVDGQQYSVDQLYEVRQRILTPVLTPERLERALPAKWDDLSDEGSSGLEDAIGDAWDDVLDDLQAKGYEPDKVMDPDRLRQPHLEKALANLARTWGPDWTEWATLQATLYRQALEDALSSGGWYDTREDSKQEEAEVKWPAITLQR